MNESKLEKETPITITAPSKLFYNGLNQKAIKEQLSLEIVSSSIWKDGRTGKKTPYYQVKFNPVIAEFSLNSFYIEEDLVVPIAKEEIVKFTKNNKALNKAFFKKKNEFIVKLKTKKVGYRIREIEHHSKNFLATNTNYLHLGEWNQKNNTFTVRNLNRGGACCGLTHTTHDIQVFFPKLWTDYFGYSLADIKRWLEFISKCEIGFKYSFEGLQKLPKNLQSFTNHHEDDVYHISDRAAIPFEKDYYCVRIKGSKYTQISYLQFIILRYLYNDQYWSIPATAMQIKAELKDKVTYWQALLMAHLRLPYYNFYALFGTTTSHYVDIFDLTPKKVLTKLHNTAITMNSCFPTEQGKAGFAKQSQEFFKNKEYSKLFELLKSQKGKL